MKFEKDQHSLHIPNFKVTKKHRGQEVVTFQEIKSNLDVFSIFNQDLTEQKIKLFKKQHKSDQEKFDLALASRRDESIDPSYADQLLQGLPAYENAEHVHRNAPRIMQRV